MAKKHKHPEHVDHERWLVSYADFITLLFATFTALYALSKSDADKAKAMAESMRISFGSPANSMIPKAVLSYLGIPADKSTPAPPTKQPKAEKAPTQEAGKGELEAVKNQLESFLMMQKLLGKVRIEVNNQGLLISLTEAGFFESSKADLLEESKPLLAEVAEKLRDFSNTVRVEGHTDSIPIRSRTYPSNWELSTARASQVARMLATEYGIWPQRLSAVGYAEFRPAYSNATEAGRNRNRRVDIVVLTSSAHAAPTVESVVEKIVPTKSPWSPHEDAGATPVEIP